MLIPGKNLKHITKRLIDKHLENNLTLHLKKDSEHGHENDQLSPLKTRSWICLEKMTLENYTVDGNTSNFHMDVTQKSQGFSFFIFDMFSYKTYFICFLLSCLQLKVYIHSK